MEQRYATHPDQITGMTTEQLRAAYLVPDVFVPGEIALTYTHHDRIVIGGACPTDGPLLLTAPGPQRTEDFWSHRELGVVNVAAQGEVRVDGETYTMPRGACLYVGRGAQEVVFAGERARFYLFSAPAHTAYPTVLTRAGEGTRLELGDPAASNVRTLHQYIHAGGVQSCQIVMGVTELHPGSVWNTMPAHTHDRRTECYLYFDVPHEARVVHLLGEASETRHLMVADRQAVISPAWSIHSGVGTAAYSFVWAMAGENREFSDMDGVPPTHLR